MRFLAVKKRLAILTFALLLALPVNALAVTGLSATKTAFGNLTVRSGAYGVVLFKGSIATSAIAHWAKGATLDSCANRCQADWTSPSTKFALVGVRIGVPAVITGYPEFYDPGFFWIHPHDTLIATYTWSVTYAALGQPTCSGTVTARLLMSVFADGGIDPYGHIISVSDPCLIQSTFSA